MDTQYLDGYFTNLVYEMEASRNRITADQTDAYRIHKEPRDRLPLPWLVALALVWFGAVTLGLWL
jgi:hypothetical protein